MEGLIESIHCIEKSQEYTVLLEKIRTIVESNKRLTDSISVDLVDEEFIEDIKDVVKNSTASVYFGQSLRSMKLVIPDNCGVRYHNIFLEYEAPKKLILTDVPLPHTDLLNVVHKSISDVIETLTMSINRLGRYFAELELIDQFCSIVEPINASFKDDYRRIFLDDRTWLHVEVTPEGLASNVHLIGHSIYWHNKLQSRLMMWDHDKTIVDNIMVVFEISMFPQATQVSLSTTIAGVETQVEDPIACCICLNSVVPSGSGLPQPLCQNVICGVSYHRTCLYQWLVSCAGNRPPAFGVATGVCPSCQHTVTCSEKD